MFRLCLKDTESVTTFSNPCDTLHIWLKLNQGSYQTQGLRKDVGGLIPLNSRTHHGLVWDTYRGQLLQQHSAFFIMRTSILCRRKPKISKNSISILAPPMTCVYKCLTLPGPWYFSPKKWEPCKCWQGAPTCLYLNCVSGDKQSNITQYESNPVGQQWADLEHEHGELLVVFPLLHGRLHVSRSSRERGAAALTGKLSVILGHLLKLLPQVLGNNLSPFYRHKHKRCILKGTDWIKTELILQEIPSNPKEESILF